MTARATFLQNCQSICAQSTAVTINYSKIDELAATFKQSANAPGWEAYLSTDAKNGAPDITCIFFEFALICAQQGGFIYEGTDGQPAKWALNGSGAAAMVAKFDEIRAAKALPCIDIQDERDLRSKLIPLLADVPFADERLAMFGEFVKPETYAALDQLVTSRKDAKTGSYHLDFAFAEQAAALFPESFATDPFRKKIILAVLMTAAHAQTRGVDITTDVPVASDYVLPQVLEGLGILKLSPNLEAKITAKTAFNENSADVRAVRAATIVACEELSRKSGARAQDIDGFLWLAGRDPAVKPKLKPAINVYTTWF